MSNRKTVHVRIEGRVQGVWYRGWTVDQATARGLDGWVRNLADGAVEAVFSGPENMVDDMLVACHDGPPAARVTALLTESWPDVPATGFHKRPTA